MVDPSKNQVQWELLCPLDPVHGQMCIQPIILSSVIQINTQLQVTQFRKWFPGMDRFANASWAEKLKDRQGMSSAVKQVISSYRTLNDIMTLLDKIPSSAGYLRCLCPPSIHVLPGVLHCEAVCSGNLEQPN